MGKIDGQPIACVTQFVYWVHALFAPCFAQPVQKKNKKKTTAERKENGMYENKNNRQKKSCNEPVRMRANQMYNSNTITILFYFFFCFFFFLWIFSLHFVLSCYCRLCVLSFCLCSLCIFAWNAALFYIFFIHFSAHFPTHFVCGAPQYLNLWIVHCVYVCGYRKIASQIKYILQLVYCMVGARWAERWWNSKNENFHTFCFALLSVSFQDRLPIAWKLANVRAWDRERERAIERARIHRSKYHSTVFAISAL